MLNNDQLLDVAVAIADGSPVDWISAASSAGSAEERALLAELRLIADVAAPPDAWGPFVLLERVGGGTFGEVFRARDTRLDREVALKLLRRDQTERAGRSSAVVHEARMLARIRHANVVTVFGADCIDGQVGIWMEFVRGETLDAELKRQGPLSAAEAVHVGVAVTSAVAAVHAAGLVHRDVKAQNVMRAVDGRVMLTDFGAGCEVASDAPARELAGTPLYLAPEVMAGSAATHQSDIYSIGVLLFYLVSGTFPVTGRTLDEVGDRHARGQRTALRHSAVRLPSRLIDVIDRALDPMPHKRWSSAEALAAALTTCATRPARRGVVIGIVSALLVTIAAAVASIGGAERSPNASAYALYMKGRALADPHRGTRDLRRAIILFEQATKEDPGYAAAYAALAEAWALMSINYGGVAPAEAVEHLEPAARKAVELDSRLPAAHTAMGVAAARRYDWAAAEASFKTALTLDRTRAATYVAYAIAAQFPQGKLDDAVRMLTTAMRYEPLPNEILRQLSWVQVSRGDYDDAISNAQIVAAADPFDLHVRQVHARALLQKGDAASAIAMLESQGPPSHGFLGYAYAVTGRRQEAERIARASANFPARHALVSAGLGDLDACIDALERMLDAGEPRAGIYLTLPELVAIRRHPRYAALRMRLNLQ